MVNSHVKSVDPEWLAILIINQVCSTVDPVSLFALPNYMLMEIMLPFYVSFMIVSVKLSYVVTYFMVIYVCIC